MRKLPILLFTAVFALSLALPAYAAESSNEELKAASQYLNSHGIMVGDGEGNMNFSAPLTRAHLATILARLHGGSGQVEESRDFYAAQCKFQDVPDWARQYAGYCAYHGLMVGYGDGLFGAEDPVTPAAACTVILRYLALLASVLLPGLYLAVIRFHTQVLPANLILSFAEAREGVPFSSVAELIFLELAFELIREAGVRVPGTMGNAIGIVGGLIIGQAAVSANLVSPIVVMIVAITALGSMALPNEEFASAFRLLKYMFLLLGGYLGIFGLVAGIYLTLSHLSGLLSFGMPYLIPFVKKEPVRESGDGILRIPFHKRWQRPVYTRKEQKCRLRKTGEERH